VGPANSRARGGGCERASLSGPLAIRPAPRILGALRSRLFVFLVVLLASLLLAEAALWALGIPRTAPFLQEFNVLAPGPGGAPRLTLKLMCYDSNPSGDLDLDLSDPAQRLRYEPLFPDGELAAHWRDTPYGVEVRYNQAGLRERELAPKADGVRRIVVVGDSFTYGHGLPEAKSYPRQLERILRERAPDAAVEVLNCGQGAANLAGIQQLVEFSFRALEPDVLVYGYFLNDPLDFAPPTAFDDAGRVHDMLDVGWLHAEVAPSRTRFSLGARPLRGPRLYEALVRAGEQRRLTADTFEWYRDLHGPPAWPRAEAALASMRAEAERRGCRFVLLVLPVIWKLDGDYPLEDVHAHIASSARALGIEVVDALAALRGHHDSELMLHPRDRHPSGRYARIVAETLADALGG